MFRAISTITTILVATSAQTTPTYITKAATATGIVSGTAFDDSSLLNA